MSGSTTYMSTTYNSTYEGCYSMAYSSPTAGYTSKSDYISNYSGTPTGYDIGYQPSDAQGDIWMANDNATSPVACYQVTSGGIVMSLEASIGIGSDIRGVTFEEGSGQYLWVSNQTTDELYRIELTTGTEDASTIDLPGIVEITASQNPFYSSTVITLTGFPGEVSLEVFDLRGRRVMSEVAEGCLLLDGTSLPSGAYLIRATDETGNSATASVLKL
ncbi:MAG: T9SS type A sorting domain-containing protein [Candidatus Fermentibacteria bacterium]|nr:T9SS type A sorting domain-containing protein [Candidatus Fermentibacteria bacterium]